MRHRLTAKSLLSAAHSTVPPRAAGPINLSAYYGGQHSKCKQPHSASFYQDLQCHWHRLLLRTVKINYTRVHLLILREVGRR
jgi:hypothetical protein